MSAALPRKIFPPLFNRYEGGEAFGYHVDNALRPCRARLSGCAPTSSATLFFSEPDSYDGGELVVDDTYGPRAVELPAGHMVLYPGTSLHKVTPVTRGARISAFFLAAKPGARRQPAQPAAGDGRGDPAPGTRIRRATLRSCS